MSVNIPTLVKDISYALFSGIAKKNIFYFGIDKFIHLTDCYSLNAVHIPTSVIYIGDYAFNGNHRASAWVSE